jgi:hypothetical protein
MFFFIEIVDKILFAIASNGIAYSLGCVAFEAEKVGS